MGLARTWARQKPAEFSCIPIHISHGCQCWTASYQLSRILASMINVLCILRQPALSHIWPQTTRHMNKGCNRADNFFFFFKSQRVAEPLEHPSWAQELQEQVISLQIYWPSKIILVFWLILSSDGSDSELGKCEIHQLLFPELKMERPVP